MQFIVIGRLIDTPVVPPEQELGLLIQTFRHFSSREDPRIKAVYPFADTRTTALIVDVDSANELSELLGGLPASRLSAWEGHPVATPESVLGTLEGWAATFAGS